MAQYFLPRAARRSVSGRTDRTESSALYLDADDGQTDLEQSIYIFPNPGSSAAGSAPSSPFTTSSVLSVPTDVSFPTTSASSSRRRGARRRMGSTASVNGDGTDWEAVSGRSVSVDTSLHSPGVEIWEISGDEDERDAEAGIISGASSDIGSGELEEAVERASRWDVLYQTEQQRFPLGRQPFPSAFAYAEGRFRFRRRMRSLSKSTSLEEQGDGSYRRVRKLSHQSLSKSLSRPPTPQPPLRLPLLSFFSSIISLDESTMHLLTRPAHAQSSPLFNGPRLHLEDPDINIDEKRGLFRRLGAPELHSVREGVDAACNSSVTPENMFMLPLPSLPFLSLWSYMNNVYNVPVKIWSGVRRSARAIPTS